MPDNREERIVPCSICGFMFHDLIHMGNFCSTKCRNCSAKGATYSLVEQKLKAKS